MTDESTHARRGCGCLTALANLLSLALVVALVAALVYVGAPGLLRSRLLPSDVERAAAYLGSEVATSARAFVPIGSRLAEPTGMRGAVPHIVPVAGKKVSPKTIKFTYDAQSYSITPHIANDVYWGAKRSTALMMQLPGETTEQWTQAYYHAYADDPAQKPAIDDVARQLRAIRDRAHLSNDQYLELIAKYVQSIPYDWKMYASGTGKQRFPVETLVDGIGLCGDKSVLMADLLAHEGYAAALLDFGPEKHMAVGVAGPGHTYANSGYLFLETTSPCYVTDVPAAYTGGMHLHSEPIVIPIGNGTGIYGAADQIAKIVGVRDSAKAAADQLYREAKSQPLTSAQVTQINRRLNQAYKAQTSLQSNVVDRNGQSVGTFLDRPLALKWIDRNAWWM